MLTYLINHKHCRRFVVVLTLVCLLWGALRGTGNVLADPKLPPNDPNAGLIYDGLEPSQSLQDSSQDGTCAKLYRVKGTQLCSHGPDPAKPGRTVAGSPQPLVERVAAAPTTVPCFGDGQKGPRTQVIYARAQDRPDRYAVFLPSFQHWAADADQIYYESAAETGGARHIRFVHDAKCVPLVDNVVLSPTGDDTFGNTIIELQARGYNRTDRKYMIFMDANIYCGIGGIRGDDTPDPSNANNGGPSYGRTDAGCWGAEVAAHEHMHNLGGVQMSAPQASGGWHCTDEYDLMCYSDAPYYPAMVYTCTDPAHDRLFDCNHDDYYSSAPASGSYLATHWNAANSQFLFTPHWVHIATSGNVNGHMTYIDHLATIGNPNALLLVTQNWNPGGVGGTYNPHTIGVWYDAGASKWAIFNQDLAAMPAGAAFNIEILDAGPSAFVHKATAGTIGGHITYINHPATNGNPAAILEVTQNWNPGGLGGAYNNHNIGVWYNGGVGKWAIFNQDFASMPVNAAFNVKVLASSGTVWTHKATVPTLSGHMTYINNPATNGKPNLLLQVTQNWNSGGSSGTYNDHPYGVWYDAGASKWAIFNQDFVAMPANAAFNVEVLQP